jgi:hypothetical protein
MAITAASPLVAYQPPPPPTFWFQAVLQKFAPREGHPQALQPEESILRIEVDEGRNKEVHFADQVRMSAAVGSEGLKRGGRVGPTARLCE